MSSDINDNNKSVVFFKHSLSPWHGRATTINSRVSLFVRMVPTKENDVIKLVLIIFKNDEIVRWGLHKLQMSYPTTELLKEWPSTVHCHENPIYVFLFSSIFQNHVSVSDLYIYSQGPVHIFPAAEYADRSWEDLNHSKTYECGNWDCGREILVLCIFACEF
jgi:hypothetical protein